MDVLAVYGSESIDDMFWPWRKHTEGTIFFNFEVLPDFECQIFFFFFC